MNYVVFVLLGIFWSLSFLAIKITVISIPPIFSAFLRVLIAQIAFTLFFVTMRHKLKAPFASIWRLWGVGIFLQGIPFLLLFIGECYVAPALASIINSTVPVWVFLLGISFFGDARHVNIGKFMGLALGMVGACFIFLPMLQGDNTSRLFGVLAITGMAISYALGALLNQRFCKSKFHVNLQASLWHQHWGSLSFLALCTLIFEHHFDITPVLHSSQVLFALLYLGIFSTAIAWFIYCHLISTWGAVRASTVLYMVPILTLIWDGLFLHLAPGFNEIAGIVFILLGVSLIQFCKKPQGVKQTS